MPARVVLSLPSWAVALLLIAAAIGVHAPILGCSFFSDDFQVLWRLGTNGDSSFFRPLSDLTLQANLALAGPEAWTFRMVNLTLLGINGWLVHVLAKRLIGSEAALSAGLLFVFYPFHLEPQAWIIGRGIALAAAFTLGALVVAISNAPSAMRAIAVALLVLLGAFCYESTLLTPLLLTACWLIVRPPDHKAWRAMVVASGAAVVLNLAIRHGVLGGLANDYGAAFFVKPVGDYLSSAMKLVGRSFLPPHAETSVQTVRFTLLLVVLAAVAIWVWRSNRARPERLRTASLLVVLFGITSIIPCVGGVSTRTSESDRFLYLPSAFLCILLAFLVNRISQRTLRLASLGVVLLASCYQLRGGMEHWRIASRTVERILVETPRPPQDGRLIVSDLPGDHEGAYIFRHGFREALLLGGREVDRIVVETDSAEEARLGDRRIKWTDDGFVDEREP